MHRRLFRVAWSWIASLALMLMSVAPLLSQAIANPRAGAPFEICSVSGLLMHSADPSERQRGNTGHLLEHCPCCALHADTLAPPPAPLAAWVGVRIPRDVPVLFLQAAHTAHAWVSARPRGPPHRIA